MVETLRSLRQKASLELEKNLLPFWLKYARDDGKKGFTGRLSNNLVREPASKGLVLHARLLWTFSSLFQFNSDLRCLKLAQECYAYIYTYFLDPECGGAYWSLSAEGRPEDMQKKTYGQVFLIYAMSEYYKCCPNPSILTQCSELFLKLERYALDQENLGYFEVCRRDWTVAEDQRLSDKDMDEKKSMNTHLHLLEAFTNLYSIWKDDLLKRRLIMLLEIFREKIIQPETGHFGLFFNDAWGLRSRGISFGHEIEASWLICEAAKVLDDSEMLTQYEYIGGMLAEGAYTGGLDALGGLNYEINEQGVLDTDKHFWAQAEAAVGFLNAWEMTCQDEYLETAMTTWDFIQNHLVDKKYGEWFWKVNRTGVPDYDQPKISDWKCPYHNMRACMEIVKRIDMLLVQHGQQKDSSTYGKV